MNKELLNTSLQNSRYEAAKEKAILEEPPYDSYMPPTPAIEPPEHVPVSVGLRTFIKSFAP